MIILSKMADYGVIIATQMALDPERQMTAASMAEQTRLPRTTVAKVLKALAHGGVVAGSRGASGGYKLARAPEAISIATVVAAIDGEIGPTQCTIHGPSCERTDFCSTKPHWQLINDAVGNALSAMSLAEMVPNGLLARWARMPPPQGPAPGEGPAPKGAMS
jgi:FeS assembly SUF system regulator